jgi:hypothetical protein
MTWLAPKLDKRVQIGEPIQEANDDGGFDFSFTTLLTVWMGMKPITPGEFMRAQYIRGAQILEGVSHRFIVRRTAISSLSKEYGKGFGNGFDSMEDLTMVKSNYFLFVQHGSTVRGRLFRIRDIVDNMEQGEYFHISAEEIEQRGTGYLI